MAQVQLKGILKSVGTPIEKATKFRVQTIQILIPGYVDQFGDKKGKDQVFDVDLKNDQIEQFAPHLKPGAKIIVDCYLNSNAAADGSRNFLNLALAKLEVKVAAPAPKQDDDAVAEAEVNGVAANDDLLF